MTVKFKVGDRVQRNFSSTLSFSIARGEIITVTSVDYDTFRSDDAISTYDYPMDDFTLVKVENQFKIGDKVKANEDHKNSYSVDDKEVIVTAIEVVDGLPSFYTKDSIFPNYPYRENHFELVRTETDAEKAVKLLTELGYAVSEPKPNSVEFVVYKTAISNTINVIEKETYDGWGSWKLTSHPLLDTFTYTEGKGISNEQDTRK